ncbi:MAG: Ni/Fe hydrogenase subunit alpha [Patescibacteria group bacterium]
MKIKIDHICKIEGHADFIADIERGDVKTARFRTLEGARLIEGILIGRKYIEPTIITPRICGICPVVHNLTSTKAIEACFDIEPTEQVILLRKILELAQFIHSHGIHLFFLTLPDFFKIKTELKMLEKFPKEAQMAIRVRNFGVDLVKVIGGRTVHPITTEIGGIKRLPDRKALHEILSRYDSVMEDALALAKVFAGLEYPELFRKQDYMSLHNSSEYAIYDGDVMSLHGTKIPASKFMHSIEEVKRPYELIKHAKYRGDSYFVGAIARINNNQSQLNPVATKVLRSSGLKFPSYNNFHNIMCQAIELVHCLEESKKLLNQYFKQRSQKLNVPVKVKAGRGVGAVEAPRGTLYHYYETDKNGFITDCNIITPTAQQVPNLEQDLKTWIPNVMQLDEKTRVQEIRKLIRAYDPCMTCATH